MMKSDATLPPPTAGNRETLDFSDQMVNELCQVFKLLADETRLRILIYLAQERELNVTELCDRLGQSQPAVSHHLALMRVARLIEPRRDGKHNYYSVREEHFHDLIRSLSSTSAGKTPQVRFHDFVISYEGELDATLKAH